MTLGTNRAVHSIGNYLTSFLEYRRDLGRIPGMQVAIRADGELVYSQAFGVADVESGAPLSVDSLFHIASHSKTFTATACFQLVESNKLRLDDTVGAWVSDLCGAPIGWVTVREILGHQGGAIRDGVGCDWWQGIKAFPDRQQLMELGKSDLVYEPNSRFKYSNVAYSILGEVIAAASGMPYAQYVQTHILDALGLRNIGCDYEPSRANDYAKGHAARLLGDSDTRPLPGKPANAMAPATGFWANAEDLTRYASAHCFGTDELLTDASKRLMGRVESTIQEGSTSKSYGLGFALGDVGDRKLRGHSGGYPGFVTHTWLDPDDKLTVSVLTNIWDSEAQTLATSIVKLIDLARNGDAEVNETADLASYTGRFAGLASVLDIAVFGNRLVALEPRSIDPAEIAWELTPTGPDALMPSPEAGFGAVGEPIICSRDEVGEIASLTRGGLTFWPMHRVLAGDTPLP